MPRSIPTPFRPLLRAALVGSLLLTALPARSARAELKPAGTEYPLTTIVKLRATFGNKTKNGSGVLIGRYHVLTCAHALYDAGMGGYASSVEVIPQARGKNQPFGIALSTKQRVFKEWMEFNRKNPGGSTSGTACDIGLVTLDRPIGDAAGWMAIGWTGDEGFKSGRIFNLAGYPDQQGFSGWQMCIDSGPIEGLEQEGRSFTYKPTAIRNVGGMSGGPVWTYDAKSKERVVYGINIGRYDDGRGQATRISTALFKQLKSWMDTEPEPEIRNVTARANANP